jgi:hypothetical protein
MEEKQTQVRLADWAQVESERVGRIRAQMLERMGFKPFLKLPVGESILEFEDRLPKASESMPGKFIFRVRCNGGEYDLPVRENSSLYREIVKALSKGNTRLTVVREGTGKKDTKYSVKS